MKSVIVALALGTGNAYVTPLKPVHTQLSKLSMQSGVGDLYNSKGVSTSAVAVADEVAEDEVIELKQEDIEEYDRLKARRGAGGRRRPRKRADARGEMRE